MIEAYFFLVIVLMAICLTVTGIGCMILLAAKICEWITGRSRQRSL
jgi:hypothetical protein